MKQDAMKQGLYRDHENSFATERTSIQEHRTLKIEWEVRTKSNPSY